MMSAYSIQDSVNKYRHGVLVGNFVEDKFGTDLHEKGPNPDVPKITTSKDHHDLNHSLYKKDEFLNSQQPSNSQFYDTARQRAQNYTRPETQSTYSIFHRQEVPNKLPLQNNPKRQQKLEKEGKLYDYTRTYLANKYTGEMRQQGGSSHEDIPDILTGQIFKPKANIGGQIKKDDKGKPKIEQKVETKSINPFGGYSIIKPEIQKFQNVEYNKFVKPSMKGQHRDILFGHGIALEDFQKRQLSTSYDLSYGQKVMPQTQINSFYNPDLNTSAKQFHRETLYEKNYQPNIPAYGETKILAQEKAGRPYQPYTSTYDKNHLKHQYLRK